MTKPIFILAGQSNARRMSEEVHESLTSRYGEGGYIVVQIAIAGARLTWENDDRDDWATESELPAQLISALTETVLANPDSSAAGMIWVQGESDTRTGSNPDLYQNRLQSLVDRIQEDIPQLDTAAARSFADMPVVISQLSESSTEYFERVAWDTIIHEQGMLATRSDDFEVLDPDAVARETGFTHADMFADSLHYTDGFNAVLADRLIAQVLDQNTTDSAAVLPVIGQVNAEILSGGDSSDFIRGLGGEDELSGLSLIHI